MRSRFLKQVTQICLPAVLQTILDFLLPIKLWKFTSSVYQGWHELMYSHEACLHYGALFLYTLRELHPGAQVTEIRWWLTHFSQMPVGTTMLNSCFVLTSSALVMERYLQLPWIKWHQISSAKELPYIHPLLLSWRGTEKTSSLQS